MNKSTDHIRLNINSGRLVKKICVRQNDTIARTIAATFANEGVPVVMEGSHFAEIFIKRPDGTETINSCVISGDEIQYTLRSNDISVLGESVAQFRISYKDGDTFTSPDFIIEVYKKEVSDSGVVSQNDYSAATVQLAVASGYADDAKKSADDASDILETIETLLEDATAIESNIVLEKQEIDQAKEDTLGYKQQAQASASAAAVSESNALSYKNQASASVDSMTALLDAATAAKNAAVEAKDEAIVNKNAAASSATESLSYATLSGEYKDATNTLKSETAELKSQAETSKNAAAGSAQSAEGYKDDARYYYEQARAISESLSGALKPMGTVTFSELPSVYVVGAASEGDMYNISDAFTTTSDFQEGEGKSVAAGANVYLTANRKWDILAGTTVVGVKGAKESSYRQGYVNIKPEDIGVYDATSERKGLVKPDGTTIVVNDYSVVASEVFDSFEDNKVVISYFSSQMSAALHSDDTALINFTASDLISKIILGKEIGMSGTYETIFEFDVNARSYSFDKNLLYYTQGSMTGMYTILVYRSTSAISEITANALNTEAVISAALPELADVATSGSYNDLLNKPSLATVATSGSYSDLSNKPSLANVATSGSYSDLSNKPSLANVATSGSYSDLSNKPSLATVATSGSYSDLSNKPTIPNTNWTGALTSALSLQASTTDLTAGSSSLTSGKLYVVYE